MDGVSGGDLDFDVLDKRGEVLWRVRDRADEGEQRMARAQDHLAVEVEVCT